MTKLGDTEKTWSGKMSSMITSTENLVTALVEA